MKVTYGEVNNLLPFFAGLFINLKTSAGNLFGRGLLFSINNPSFVRRRRMMSIGRIAFFIIPD
jgi:hypothetical protein